ncbi:MAG: DUF4988 and DUF4465 domain-containing protein [Alistipes sp.]|nr:DUF4988 and DUF4465 domain-containing protein [Alistipes sp.]
MKRILTLILSAALVFTGCSYNDDDLWNAVDDLEDRVSKLEEVISRMNTDISSLQTLINAVNQGDFITGFSETASGDGWIITLSSGETINLKHGTAGSDAPVIGVAEDTDGVYYWTVTVDGQTDWLRDGHGNRMPVTGARGETGADAVTPVIGVDDEGYWTVDYGNGPERIQSDGKDVMATDESYQYLFTGYQDNGRYYTFYLANGEEVHVVKRIQASIVIDADPQEYFRFGQERIFSITTENVSGSNATCPRGWDIDLDIFNRELWIKAPAQGSGNSSGIAQVSVTGSDGATFYSTFQVYADTYELKIVDFEGSYWDALIDSPQYDGPLLYGSGESSQSTLVDYKWYDQGNTELASHLLGNNGYYEYSGYKIPYTSYTYSGGGEAISNYTGQAVESAGFYEQLSIPNASGRRGSANFAVHYGYSHIDSEGNPNPETLPAIYFEDGTARVVDHMWVTSTSYFLNSVTNGDYLLGALTGTVEITAIGWPTATADDTQKKKATFTLADGQNGLIRDWTKWDLSGLGAVVKIEFNMDGTPADNYADGSFARPAYFAYDDIAVRF